MIGCSHADDLHVAIGDNVPYITCTAVASILNSLVSASVLASVPAMY